MDVVHWVSKQQNRRTIRFWSLKAIRGCSGVPLGKARIACLALVKIGVGTIFVSGETMGTKLDNWAHPVQS